MVPRETWRQRRTQPNPARILTLEPERSVTERKKARREMRLLSWILRAQAACGFTKLTSKRSPFFHTCKVIAASLRASVSRASSGFIPFRRRFS